MVRLTALWLLAAACSSTTPPPVAPEPPPLASEAAAPTETAPPAEAAPPVEKPAPVPLTEDQKLDNAFKGEKLTEHKLGFHYLALPTQLESAPADRVVVFEDKDYDGNDDLPRASRIIVMLDGKDTKLVRGAAAKDVTDAVTKYATIRGMAPGFFSKLADAPCTSAHYEASCYAGKGEYLKQAGMGGRSRSLEFYVVIAERDGRRALIIATEREARSAQFHARGTVRLAK